MTWNKYRQAVEREFPPGTTVKTAQGGGVEITVPCKHGHTETVAFRVHMPPDKAKRVFVNKGWRFWGKSTTCPEHTRKDDQPMPANEGRATLKASLQSTASDVAIKAAEPVASVVAREAKRMAMLLLEEKFDAKNGRKLAALVARNGW